LANTQFTSVLAQAIKNILVTNKTSLGLRDVLYGNHTMLPVSPVAVVIPAPKHRDLQGVGGPGGRTLITMNVYIDVLSSKVGDESEERLALDQLAERVEDLLHNDVTVGGLLIHGFVTDWVPGETTVQGGEYRTVRLTFAGITKLQLT
jgi:hypothetical protein